MIDELAKAAGKDGVDFRLSLLKDRPRETAVLKLAAEKANWGATKPRAWPEVSRFTKASSQWLPMLSRCAWFAASRRWNSLFALSTAACP